MLHRSPPWRVLADTQRKTERYTRAVAQLRDLLDWWRSLSDNEKAARSKAFDEKQAVEHAAAVERRERDAAERQAQLAGVEQQLELLQFSPPDPPTLAEFLTRRV